ncbi:hypothetical protein VF21_10070 [Pseudogymnoascus sp. 05NY08]|nr:hypothetical protein VF21_10070 [Pseudogymnoascus sp. 05NY08]
MEESQLQKATAWALDNPTESITTTARIFKVPPSKLRWSVTRAAKPRPRHGGHNKVLSDAQILALKQWILLQYNKGLGATRHMTYAAVCYLTKPQKPLLTSWLTKFIKNDLQDFHVIKTKPISRLRATAQDKTSLQQWKPKILVLLGSPSRERYENWAAGTELVLVNAQLQELDYSILERQVLEQRNQRAKSRRTLQAGGVLSVENARHLQAQKLQKEANKKARKEARIAKSATIQAHKDLHQAGVAARKEERLRKKRVAVLRKAGPGSRSFGKWE